MLHARELSSHLLTPDTLKHHRNTQHQIPLDLRLRIRWDGAHGVDNLHIMDNRGESAIIGTNFFLDLGMG